jgi:hypothetical protein
MTPAAGRAGRDSWRRAEDVRWRRWPRRQAGNRGAAAVTAGATAAIGFCSGAGGPTAAETARTAQTALAQATDAVNAAQAQLQGRGGGRGGGFGAGCGGGRGATPAVQPDITTLFNIESQRVTPQFTGDETFFEFLLSGNPVKFADLRARLDKGEQIPWVSVPSAKVTINIDNTFELLSAQYTKNVVGMVEGTDPKTEAGHLRVLRQAHLDHEGGVRRWRAVAVAGARRVERPRLARRRRPTIVMNGADDDGSGSSTLLALAKGRSRRDRAEAVSDLRVARG